MEIEIQNPGGFRGVESEALEVWLADVLRREAPGTASVAVRLVNDLEMSQLNETFRAKEGSTDVLSFPGESEGLEGWHLGDIVISVPVARMQAKKRGVEFVDELRLLVLHGVLHCLGYDHETDDGEMDRLEQRLRPLYLS